MKRIKDTKRAKEEFLRELDASIKAIENKASFLKYMAKIATKKKKGLDPYRHLDDVPDDVDLEFTDASKPESKIYWTVNLYFDGATKDEYNIYLN